MLDLRFGVQMRAPQIEIAIRSIAFRIATALVKLLIDLFLGELRLRESMVVGSWCQKTATREHYKTNYPQLHGSLLTDCGSLR